MVVIQAKGSNLDWGSSLGRVQVMWGCMGGTVADLGLGVENQVDGSSVTSELHSTIC